MDHSRPPSISCCIFDWAGTTVDYGCFAPLAVFLEIFGTRGIDLTAAEARGPMGLPKRDHIAALCSLNSVSLRWQERYGKTPGEQEIDELYTEFESALFATLHDHAAPLPGVPETMDILRSQGLKIGSTTGYTRRMIDIVMPRASEQGYAPDCCVTPSEVGAGRPEPWMIYRVCEALDVYPLSSVVKIGDTISDIQEGVNASVWSVGIIQGSSEMGLSLEEHNGLRPEERERLKQFVHRRFLDAGAHYVLESIRDVPDLIGRININLRNGSSLGSHRGTRPRTA